MFYSPTCQLYKFFGRVLPSRWSVLHAQGAQSGALIIKVSQVACHSCTCYTQSFMTTGPGPHYVPVKWFHPKNCTNPKNGNLTISVNTSTCSIHGVTMWVPLSQQRCRVTRHNSLYTRKLCSIAKWHAAPSSGLSCVRTFCYVIVFWPLFPLSVWHGIGLLLKHTSRYSFLLLQLLQ